VFLLWPSLGSLDTRVGDLSSGIIIERIVEARSQRSLTEFHSENWEQAINLVVEKPLLGHGIDRSRVGSNYYGGRSFEIHNTYLFSLAAFGFIGTLILLGPLVILWRFRIAPPLLLILVSAGAFFPILMFHEIAQSRSIWLMMGVIARLSQNPN
jgi:hypothetical protein